MMTTASTELKRKARYLRRTSIHISRILTSAIVSGPPQDCRIVHRQRDIEGEKDDHGCANGGLDQELAVMAYLSLFEPVVVLPLPSTAQR